MIHVRMIAQISWAKLYLYQLVRMSKFQNSYYLWKIYKTISHLAVALTPQIDTTYQFLLFGSFCFVILANTLLHLAWN